MAGGTSEEQFQSLLDAARAGADWAWERLYHELAPVVLGYLRGQRAPSPEDLTSEIFLQVVRDLHGFEGTEERFRSWVFTIAHHRLIDARRYYGRRPCEPVEVEVLDRALPSQLAEDEALENVTTGELAALFDTLSEDQRAVLLLRVVGGLTISEIAEIVEKRPGAVKALQRRGLAALRSEFEQRPYPVLDPAALTQVTS